VGQLQANVEVLTDEILDGLIGETVARTSDPAPS